MPDVEIRWTTFLSQVLGKRLVRFSTRAFVGERVDALGPTIENVKLDPTRESTCESCIQRVVVCVYVRRGNEYGRGEEVCRNHRLHEELINETNQLVARAALISDGRSEVVWQRILRVE